MFIHICVKYFGMVKFKSDYTNNDAILLKSNEERGRICIKRFSMELNIILGIRNLSKNLYVEKSKRDKIQR